MEHLFDEEILNFDLLPLCNYLGGILCNALIEFFTFQNAVQCIAMTFSFSLVLINVLRISFRSFQLADRQCVEHIAIDSFKVYQVR